MGRLRHWIHRLCGHWDHTFCHECQRCAYCSPPCQGATTPVGRVGQWAHVFEHERGK